MNRPTHCTMCGEEIVKNYEIGWVCPKTYGNSWYHFSIGYHENDTKLAYASFILTSHNVHLHIDYEKNRTVVTSMENGQKSKQIAWIDHAIPLDITNKEAIEQKIKLLTTFS